MSIRQKTLQLSSKSDNQDYESDEPSSPPETPTETTPLLPSPAVTLTPPTPSQESHPGPIHEKRRVALRAKAREYSVTAVQSLPAVLLGGLLNILDGVSYGMIIFPSSGVFEDYHMAPLGVSMFFVSCVLSQLTYTFGASQFPGANGSMMIEVVPFFHLIALNIASLLEDPEEILATTLASFALSSILTGLAFFLLGYLKLGAVVGFFPRHILVGCIGGVGAFLIETGLEVSLNITSDATSTPFPHMFSSAHNIMMWTIPVFLAVFLKFSMWAYGKLRKSGEGSQSIFVGYFIAIPALFYVVILAARIPIDDLRDNGWVFDVRGGEDGVGWYKFYEYFVFSKISFAAIWETLPTQFALLFFNILHPPLNVPALSISLGEDEIDTNQELVAHGYSNFLAGLFGTVPNYLVYVNTLLFYRVGGTTRISGFMLAILDAILLAAGTGFVGYIPIMVVGALIFVLGIDLVKEAVWDTRGRVSKSEYLTIICIMVCMTIFDFVIGVLFGIVMCCLFFVIQTSRLSVIRAIHTGSTAPSTVRRPAAQRAYIREVSGMQTCVLRLGGHMFFGNVNEVELGVAKVLSDSDDYKKKPGLRFLVLDLTHVVDVDMSSLEGLVRVRRVLEKRNITMVICGVKVGEGPVGVALKGFFEESEGHGGEPTEAASAAARVEVFDTFGDAMEWTENAYLRVWFRSQKTSRPIPLALPGRQDADIPSYLSDNMGSPRRVHLYDAGARTIANDLYSGGSPRPSSVGVTSPRPLDVGPPRRREEPEREPIPTLRRAFSSYMDMDIGPLVPYLQLVSYPAGYVLWRQGDAADGLYVIEKGVLRALYAFKTWAGASDGEDRSESRIEESMVSGTLAGELTALSDMERNATVVVEQDCVLWKLTRVALKRMQEEDPKFASAFVEAVLKAAKIDYDVLFAALATRR
ncbi:hypothetical protein CYLTODRAFT_454835 [Cylindrobasidium torrendii FP15055 ss-10]|uniref:Sulfate transporter family protein n=1 Tax=Cylindrobasidium torrendii FP15055 ss-10 TaxID=1314674 RepID=A0A0D7B943_9AGAR|nr:hypothetical protein CYLTODRAFT_454835 [Cylindrobasidium torrendii FP15055 ss-10]